MALSIDPDDLPDIPFLIFEDGDGDRWMAGGYLRTIDPDGTEHDWPVDIAGGPFRIGGSVGEVFFCLDTDDGRAATGITGPTIASVMPTTVAAVPGTAGQYFFRVGTVKTATPGDFVQDLLGAATLNNRSTGLPDGVQAVQFLDAEGAVVGQLDLLDGRWLYLAPPPIGP